MLNPWREMIYKLVWNATISAAHGTNSAHSCSCRNLLMTVWQITNLTTCQVHGWNKGVQNRWSCTKGGLSPLRCRKFRGDHTPINKAMFVQRCYSLWVTSSDDTGISLCLMDKTREPCWNQVYRYSTFPVLGPGGRHSLQHSTRWETGPEVVWSV